MTVRDRHLEFFLHLTEAAEPRLQGRDMVACLDQLEAEQDNLRAAMEWALEADPLAALRLVGVLHVFWARRMSASEGLNWVRTALARAQDAFPPHGDATPSYLRAKARALAGEAALSFGLGDSAAALPPIEASISLARKVKDPLTLAFALGLGATVCGFMGDVSTAKAYGEESLELCRHHNYSYGLAMYSGFRLFLAVVAAEAPPPGSEDEMLGAARASGNPWVMGLAYQNLGRLTRDRGDTARALNYLEQAVAIFEQMKDRAFSTATRSEIAHSLRIQDRYDEALVIYRITIHELAGARTPGSSGTRAGVHGLHRSRHRAGRTRSPSCSAPLKCCEKRSARSMTPLERREYDRAVSQLRQHMAEAPLAAAWNQGRALSMDEAIACALEEATPLQLPEP